MDNKIFFRGLCMVLLVVSLVFLVPANVGMVFADDTASKSSSDVTAGQVSREQAASECSIVPPLDIKGSLILSIVFLCIPGVLEKAQEWRQIKCDEVVCSYEAVKSSLDPSFCSVEAGFKVCKYVVGEVFAIPPMSIVEYLKDFIANILANPIGIAWGVVAKLARLYATTCAPCDSTVMGASMLFLGFTDITAMIQTFQDMAENGFFPSFSYESSCEDLEDITKEMEEIISEGKRDLKAKKIETEIVKVRK